MPVQEGVFVVALKEAGNGLLQVLLQFRQNTGLHDGQFAFPEESVNRMRTCLLRLVESFTRKQVCS
jgi:hypothetical protein